MAPVVKFTEQAQVLAVGEGLGKTAADGPTTFKIPVADPVAGRIGVILLMKATLPPEPARAGGPPPAPVPPTCSWRCASRCRASASPRRSI